MQSKHKQMENNLFQQVQLLQKAYSELTDFIDILNDFQINKLSTDHDISDETHLNLCGVIIDLEKKQTQLFDKALKMSEKLVRDEKITNPIKKQILIDDINLI